MARGPGAGGPAVRSVRTRLQDGSASIAELNALAAWRGGHWRPDVVLNAHVHSTPGALLAARGTPVVTYAFADELTHIPSLTRLAARRSQALISISRYTTSLLEEHRPRGPVALVLPAFDPRPIPVKRSAHPTILTVSRLADRYKGHDIVLEAMTKVVRSVPDAEWLIAGDGPLRGELEARREALGLQRNVRFLGYVDDSERDRLFGSAWAFVMPSRLPERGAGGEGFGIVYLEAAAAGVPVIAANVAGALDAVHEGVTGLLVDPNDPQAVAAALVTLLSDPQRAAAMSEASIGWARKFTWERMAHEVDVVLQAVRSSGA